MARRKKSKLETPQLVALGAAGGALWLMMRKAGASESIAQPGAPAIPYVPGTPSFPLQPSVPAARRPAPAPAPAVRPLPNTPTVVTTRTTLLKLGMSGPHVATAQRQLAALGLLNANTDVDGAFGRKTEAAVKAFQKQTGLKVDGIIGPETARELSAF